MFRGRTLLIATLLLVFAPLVVSQQATQATARPCSFNGWTANGLYQNPHFHISYRLPSGWIADVHPRAQSHRFILLDLPVRSVREPHWLECALFKAFDPNDSRNNIVLTVLDFAGDAEESEQEIVIGYVRFMESQGMSVLHGAAYSPDPRLFFSMDFHDEHGRSPYSAIVVTKGEGIALVWYMYAESDDALHKLLGGVHSAFLD